MTSAQFTTFVKGHLRKASRWWKPISEVLRKARVARGVYLCAVCKQHVPSSIVVNGKRVKNIQIDHVDPIVDPRVGFTTWDDFIFRLFCEEDNLAATCSACHSKKSQQERELSKQRKEKEKDIEN
jgi:5-methylcytosine-specific restriction endonuclease McrA